MPEGVTIAWRQFRLERRMFWRNPAGAFFNFGLPLIFLVLLGLVFGGRSDVMDVLVPGIAGLAIMSTTFVALATNLTTPRETGVLKRLRGTPLPASSYLASFALHALTNAVTCLVCSFDPVKAFVSIKSIERCVVVIASSVAFA